MAIQTKRGRGITAAPNVAFASGEIYPNGVDMSPANPDLQATVRPGGWLFRPSPGYAGVRVGNHKIDLAHPQGNGIHFTPQRFAENLTAPGVPGMIDKGNDHADVADLPGSEYLDGQGRLPAYLAESNAGPYLADSSGPRVGDVQRHGGNVPRDLGARDSVTRDVTTRAFYDRLAMNPNVVLRQEWQKDPVVTTVWAVIVVGGLSMLAHNIERSLRGRGRGRGVAAVAAVPAAATAGTGAAVADSAKVANTALTEAGSAVQTAVSAAGDAVQAAGEAVDKTTTAAADATK